MSDLIGLAEGFLVHWGNLRELGSCEIATTAMLATATMIAMVALVRSSELIVVPLIPGTGWRTEKGQIYGTRRQCSGLAQEQL